MPAAHPSKSSAKALADDALLAEVQPLRGQVRQVTASGHQLIIMQARLQSLLHRTTDAVIPFGAEGTVSSFNSAARRIFDVAEIEVLNQTAGQLFDLPERCHDNMPGSLLVYARRTPDQCADKGMSPKENGSTRNSVGTE